VASLEPLAPLETAFRALPTPEFGTPVSMAEHLGKDVVRQLRGIGGLATEPPSSASPAGLFTSALSLRAEPESVVGPWMRQFTLESPRR